MLVEPVEQEGQGVTLRRGESRQALCVRFGPHECALVDGHLRHDPGLGTVEPGPDFIEAFNGVVLRVEVPQNSQDLGRVAGGDVDDRRQRPVGQRQGRAGQIGPAAVPMARR